MVMVCNGFLFLTMLLLLLLFCRFIFCKGLYVLPPSVQILSQNPPFQDSIFTVVVMFLLALLMVLLFVCPCFKLF